MKKRDRFWLNKILGVLLFTTIFIIVSLYNIIQFNSSYIQEEKTEIDIFSKQIEWAIKPLLATNNIILLEQYCNDFRKYKDFAFRIFDENHNLLASTSSDKVSKIADNDSRLEKTKHNLFKLYKQSFKDKNLEYVNELNIKNRKYFIEISLSEEDVITTIIRAQKNITIIFSICLILLILSIIQIFSSIRNSFNTLEDRVKDISKGNLNTKIEIPRNGLLEELAIAITQMTRKLKRQISRLTKLEQYKTEFLQNITHEIKTPITAINSAIELIESNEHSNPISKECFDIINFQTSSITKLVDDILALSETDLKKTEEVIDFEPVDLQEILKECIKNQGITTSKINLKIKENFTVEANKKLTIMAVSNIINNAEKYSESENIDISLYRENASIIIEIKDYGIGILDKDIEHIFERFYRVDKSRSRSKGGTGLGLAIVKNIVDLHNWKIIVNSKINEGSTFKIILNYTKA